MTQTKNLTITIMTTGTNMSESALTIRPHYPKGMGNKKRTGVRLSSTEAFATAHVSPNFAYGQKGKKKSHRC